jgi:hypothetical protein
MNEFSLETRLDTSPHLKLGNNHNIRGMLPRPEAAVRIEMQAMSAVYLEKFALTETAGYSE